MRYIRWAFLGLLAIALVAVALANRELVTLQLLPGALADLAGLNRQADLPLFLVIFGGIVAGLLIGFVWEWLREHRHRAELARLSRENAELRRELRRTRAMQHEQKDEVLALLDEAG